MRLIKTIKRVYRREVHFKRTINAIKRIYNNIKYIFLIDLTQFDKIGNLDIRLDNCESDIKSIINKLEINDNV